MPAAGQFLNALRAARCVEFPVSWGAIGDVCPGTPAIRRLLKLQFDPYLDLMSVYELFMDHRMTKINVSAPARDALGIIAAMIRAARVQRGMTAAELGVRVGVSRGVIQRIEAGEPGTSIGAVFEAAVILGIPLFEVPNSQLRGLYSHKREVNALLPRRAFYASQVKPDNDF